MELRQLRMFAMAAELESFTRAAEAMSVTQPAVSQQVGMLEHELGVPLFARCGRGVTLTVAGRHMYDYTRKALELLDTAGHEIRDAPNVVSGSIRIASCPIPAESFLPGLLAAFRKIYPQIGEFVHVVDVAEATRAVESGNADFAFTVVQPPGDQLSVKEIACQELVLVVSPEHTLAKCESVTADKLREEQFVMRESGSGTRQCTERALMDVGISPHELTIGLETNSDNTIRKAVKEGGGIAFLTPSLVQDDLELGRLVAVRSDVCVRLIIYMVSDPQHVPTAAGRAFISFVS